MKFPNLLIALFFPILISAQTITGKITDNIDVIAYANVSITNHQNKIVTGTISNENGVFEIEVKKGTYKISIDFMGYKNWSKEIVVDNDLDLGTILLKENTEALETVVIKSEKRSIERKIDRYVFNVAKSIAATGGNGIDILKVTPGIQMQNGTLEILGRGAARVLINGRLSPLEGEDLTSFLTSFSSDDIEKIEVITNPPAQYEALGNGGLINIVLKKGVLNSWRNATTIAYNQNRYNFGTLSNNFFYNKNKISFSASINATKGSFENAEGLQIAYPTNNWDIDVDSKLGKDAFSGRFLLDYKVSNKTTMGIQYFGNTNQPGGFTTTTSLITDKNNDLKNKLVNMGMNEIENKNHSINFHAITELDSVGKSVSFDADYFTFDSQNSRNFFTESFNSNAISEGITSSALNVSNQKIDNFSSKIDFAHPLKKGTLSYGVKANFTKTKSDVAYYNTITGNKELDVNRSTQFMYDENNLAAYISGNTNLSKKLQMQFGLRLESTKTKGINTTTNEENKNEYTKLFPTLYISYLKNENNNFSMSYGRRINRPNFRNLNPFRFYINDNSYSVGNPFLQPSFSNNFEVSHLYKRNIQSSLFLSATTDGMGVVFTSDAEEQTQIITRENYYTQYKYGWTESFSYRKLSWWKSQNSLNILGYHTNFTRDFGSDPKNGLQLYLTSNNTFSVSKNTKIQINSWYSSQHSRGLFSVGNMFDVSFGLQHNFTKQNLKLSLQFNDVLNTASLNNYVTTVNGVEQVYRQNESSRNFRVSLSYNFGNKKVNVRNRHFGNDDERRRSK